MRKLVVSQQLDILAEALAKEMAQRMEFPLQKQVILVLPGGGQSWLSIELAKREIVAGYQMLTVEQWARSLGCAMPTFFELASAILREIRKSSHEELTQYLCGKEERWIELAEHLAYLFQQYGEYAPQFFSEKGVQWQREIFEAIFVKGPFRAPLQTFPDLSIPKVPIYCFGIDFLPPCYWELLERALTLSVYLFSPCSHFWEDICSDWEKKKLLQYGRKKGVSKEELKTLEEYLKEAPTLLANWGKLGRETLKELNRFDWEIEEKYAPCKAALHSVLRKVQELLLAFERPLQKQQGQGDPSIKIFQTGSSRICEIEEICEEILQLAKEGVSFSEMTLLAPDLKPYVPLIELLFSRYEIPYRIIGTESKGLFIQGFKQLLGVLGGEEEREVLFESPAFSRKMGWESFEKIRQWTEVAEKQGIEALLEGLMYLTPEQSLRIEMGDAELLQEFIEVFQALSEKRVKGEKTLGEWASFLEEVVEQFLICEEEDWEFFARFLKDLRQAHKALREETFPLAWIIRFLKKPISSEIHATCLHAVRIAPFTEGNITAQKALFLIGMDEESFPRGKVASSLDLLKGESLYLPEPRDRDRYLFLRALFSAGEFLRISYGHLSKAEGKSIGPSSVVEELLQFVDTKPATLQQLSARRDRMYPKGKVSWKWIPSREIPEGEKVVSLRDLSMLAHHPWKFYLRKKWGIYLEDREEASLALQKAILVRESLDQSVDKVLEAKKLPAGILGEAISREVVEKAQEWKRQIEEPLFTAAFLQSCRKMRWIDEARVELPSLKISLGEKTRVHIVGEIQHMSKKMWVAPVEDSISGLLKVWPEWLCASAGLGISNILCLKSKKIKTVAEASQWLEKFLIYFFAAQEALSPLLPQWADALLRGGKKKRSPFQDQVMQWVMARGDFPEDFEALWEEFLQETFGGLLHAKV